MTTSIEVEGEPSPLGQSAAAPPSLDGQGTDTTPRTKAAPRYVHYRLYAKDGPLESHKPIYCNNSSISRILSKSVPPPRTAASLKRYLCRIEGFEEPDNCALYLSFAEQAPLGNATHLPLREDHGPGSREDEPIVLVVDVPAAGNRSAAASVVQPTKRLDDEEPRYVYYRVYDENDEVTSKTSFDETDSSLGRIDTLSVPPPRTVTSLKFCLLKAEEIPDGCGIQMFEDEDSETTMNDGDAVTLDADTYPGISEDKPIAIVSMEQQKAISVASQAPGSESKKLKATRLSSWGETYPEWHAYAIGDIFWTDGVLLTNYLHGADRRYYAAVDSSGKTAFVHQGDLLCISITQIIV